MSAVVDFVQLRAEYASLGLVAVALILSVGAVSTLVGMSRERVSDLYFGGAIAFVVVGRLSWLVLESPGSLLDPLVLVQLQTGMEPLAGVVGIVALVAWKRRGERDAPWHAIGAVVAGLAVATVVYDAACPLRDACYGAPASAPWGFRMSGLADTRLATPLIEAGIVMLALAGVVAAWQRLGLKAAAVTLVAVMAFTRAALMPLSVLESDAVGVETLALVALGAGALVLAAMGPARRRRPALPQ